MPIERPLPGWLRGIYWVENALLVLMLALIIGLSIMQIVLRNGFDLGVIWADSLLRVLVLWMSLWGAMVASRDNSHISIDIVVRTLSGFPKRAVLFLTRLFSAAVCGAIAWYSLTFIQFEYEDQTIAFASVPAWLCESIIPLAFSVMALRFTISGVALFVPRKDAL